MILPIINFKARLLRNVGLKFASLIHDPNTCVPEAQACLSPNPPRSLPEPLHAVPSRSHPLLLVPSQLTRRSLSSSRVLAPPAVIQILLPTPALLAEVALAASRCESR